MKRNIFLLFAVLLTLTFAGNALADNNNPQPQRVFKLKLDNAQVVPPLGSGTDMESGAAIKFNKYMRSVSVSLKISDNFSGVTDIHLHLGEAGAGDGDLDIVVTVKELEPPVMDRSFTVLEVFIGTETVDSVNNIASLYQAVRDGRVYLDVHTLDFPYGEIRGQIFPAR
jgi:hypothetical protein